MDDRAGNRAAPLAIGLILSRAFGVMFGNPVTVFGIALLFGALPQQVLGYVLAFDPAVVDSDDTSAAAGVVAMFLVSILVFLLFSALAQAALVRATGAYIEGRIAGLGECLRTGLGKALPLIGLTILFVLGVMVGWVLLIVPGIILGVMWSVSVPALVEEDAGVFEAFGRSRRLTKGARWNIFFVLVIALLITWLISAMAMVPTLMLGGDPTAAQTTPVTIVVSLISTTLTTALWSTVLTSLYFALRTWQEGPQTHALADVFA